MKAAKKIMISSTSKLGGGTKNMFILGENIKSILKFFMYCVIMIF